MSLPDTSIQSYSELAGNWHKILTEDYPNPDAYYSFSAHHLVIRKTNKIIKIQYLGEDSTVVDDHNIIKEHSFLQDVESAIYAVHPVLRNLQPDWYALEMDFIEGRLLSDIFATRTGRKPNAMALLIKAIRLSLCGIIHHQLRPRHIQVTPNGEPVFIDYGGARRASKFTALLTNLGLLNPKKSGFLYALKSIFFNKQEIKPKTQTKRLLFSLSGPRKNKPQENFEKEMQRVSDFRDMLLDGCAKSETVANEIYGAFFGSVSFYRNEMWEPIRRAIWQHVDFANTKTVVLDAGIGLAAFFAQDAGANVTAYEENADLRNIFATLSGLISAQEIPLSSKVNCLEKVTQDANIVISLSLRHGVEKDIQRLNSLQNVPEVIFRTSLSEAEILNVIGPKKSLDIIFNDSANIYRIKDKK